jgi:Tol biopolymer transport system component
MLTPGTRIGSYEVVGTLGAGGMGEVYRARDTRLGREVAFKILPEEFASDPERLARFEREARTLASLNHPHIAQIYGVDEATSEAGAHTRALAMELVEGEDLAERIARGALPLDEALPIARQIAEALEAAHDAGIIHRDLKPANVKVRPDGTVKVLDFGLAKPGTTSTGGDRARHASPLLDSPTITSPAALTMGGMILGTAAYMSPEQAKGKPVDQRADIWAFGALLYEMLSGRRAFGGEDVTDTIVSVMSKELDWSALPPSTPRSIVTLLRRTLERNAQKRLPHIGLARFEIDDAIANPVASSPDAPRSSGRRWPAVAIAAMAGLIVGAVAAWWSLPRAGAVGARPSVTFTVPMPAGVGVEIFTPNRAGGVAVSPDGTRIAFSGHREAGPPLIFVRALDTLETRAIEGTEQAQYPFWSPDGQRLAYCQQQKLKQIAIAGGVATEMADCPNPRTRGAWGADDTILFVPDYQGSLVRVSAAGGVVEPVLEGGWASSQSAFFSPVWLDGTRFLVARFPYAEDAAPEAGIFRGQLGSADLVQLVSGAASEVAWGHGELYVRRGSDLTAHTFDAGGGVISGQPRTVATRVAAFDHAGGTLAYYASPTGLLRMQRIAWFSRDGTRLPDTGQPGAFRDPRLSPDGTTLAVLRSNERGLGEIWTYDLRRNVDVRATSGVSAFNPVWFPDGRSLVAGSSGGLIRARLGDPASTPLFDTGNVAATPEDISPDGSTLLYIPIESGTARLMLRSLVDGSPPRPIGPTATRLGTTGALAPNGRWLVYDVVEGESRRLYAAPVTVAATRVPVTSLNGVRPRWRRDGRELFFVNTSEGARQVVAVPVTWTADGPEFGDARPLFALPSPATLAGVIFDVTPDGQRFVFIVDDARDRSPITVRMEGSTR